MRIHYLQHVPFEGPAYIQVWAAQKGHSITGTRLYRHEALPEMKDFDWLVVMGGPMNIYQEQEYPWLVQEKQFIAQAVKNQKTVLGICLGAQLIADVLGGKVTPNPVKEIGWFPITLSPEAGQSGLFQNFPRQAVVFHWHGDTFDLPGGAVRIAQSEGCLNQAFVYDQRVIGLQFHLECTLEGIAGLIEHCGEEIIPGPYVQTPPEILSQKEYLQEANKLMNELLNRLESSWLAEHAPGSGR
jgi:GMP synthase-like glutamine amidotransferase